LTHVLYREIDRTLIAQHNRDVTRIILVITPLLLTVLLAGLAASPALAQGCAMCQTVLPQAGEPIARGMFWCVLLLLTAPFALCATIGGWLVYQYRRATHAQSFTASVLTLRAANSQGPEST